MTDEWIKETREKIIEWKKTRSISDGLDLLEKILADLSEANV